MIITPTDHDDRGRGRSKTRKPAASQETGAHIATSHPGRLATLTTVAGLCLLFAALITLNNQSWTVRAFCYICALTGIPATAALPLYLAAKLLRKFLPGS